MPLVVKDRVKVSSTSTGTGTFTLGSAYTGYQDFSVIGNGNTTYYTITDGTNWEVGIGTYTSSGTTLSRDTVLESSNAGALVPFPVGIKEVFVTYPAEKSVYMDANNDVSGYNIENSPIGGTTPAAGTFTTLTATGQTSLGNSMFAVTPKGTNLGSFETAGGSYTQEGYFGYTNNSTYAAIRFNVRPNTGGGAFVFTTYGSPSANGSTQFLINHTSSAVNYVQVTGSATNPTLAGVANILFTGSDTNVAGALVTKGSSTINFAGSSASGVVGFGVSTANASQSGNSIQAEGAGAGQVPLFRSISNRLGTDANISMAFQPKGTGAINLAPGSSGVNISNGGTVTAITRTAAGSGYTSIPTIAISAPTTAGGVQATATANMLVVAATIQSGGTGYTNGDTLTVVGGTGTAAVITVSSVSGGVITGITIASGGFGNYSVLPTNPVSVTGGTGSSATFNLTSYGLSGTFTITNAGSGYVEQPTVSFSGGGGSGAAAYATVGSTPKITSLAGTGEVWTSSGRQLVIGQAAAAPTTVWTLYNDSFARSLLSGTGTSGISAGGTSNFSIFTNSTAQEQLRVTHTASAVNYVQVTGAATGGRPTISAQGSDTNINTNISTKGSGVIYFNNGSGTSLAAFATGAANYAVITGRAAGVAPTYGVDGSDTNIDLNLTTKGTGVVNLNTGNGTGLRVADLGGTVVAGLGVFAGSSSQNSVYLTTYGSVANGNLVIASKGSQFIALGTNTNNNSNATEQMRVSHTASAVNYVQVTGAATGSGPILSAQGSDSNISQVFQSKGTGAINLAPGSSGVNISNGGTVTAITRTAGGTSYTGFPTVAITAPTTAGGVQATASSQLVANAAAVAGGGTGYTNGDVLTVSTAGGSSPITITVTGVSGGVITSATTNSGALTSIPTSPVSVTGGTGTGATFNLTYVVAATFTITNAGSGYVEQPTVTFSGGGGSGAAAYATVGSGTIVRGLGSAISFSTPGGEAFRIVDGGTAAVNYVGVRGSSGALAGIEVGGTATNAALWVTSKGTEAIRFFTNTYNQEQFRVAHTASVVNYVQVTGSVTGTYPIISGQGSDTNVGLLFRVKGAPTGPGIRFENASGGVLAAIAASTASPANYVRLDNAATGSASGISSQGSDTNIDLNLTTKGTGGLRFQTNLGAQEQFRVAHTASAVNYVQVTGAATGNPPTISMQGSDSNVGVNFTTKGTGALRFNTGGGLAVLVNDSGGTTANYLQMQGRQAGNGPIISVEGSDTNIDLNLTTKGTGAVRFNTGGGEQARISNTASAVNYVQVTGAATGNGAAISTQGSDSNISLNLIAKGSGFIEFSTGGTYLPQFQISHTASTVNRLRVTGSITGAAPVLSAQGSDTNIDLALTPKGTGYVQFGTHTATALTISGYIEIKDSAGNVRKLAVVT